MFSKILYISLNMINEKKILNGGLDSDLMN